VTRQLRAVFKPEHQIQDLVLIFDKEVDESYSPKVRRPGRLQPEASPAALPGPPVRRYFLPTFVSLTAGEKFSLRGGPLPFARCGRPHPEVTLLG
jgi:hypothetical protein